MVVHDVDERVITIVYDVRHLELVVARLVAAKRQPSHVLAFHEDPRDFGVTFVGQLFTEARHLVQGGRCMCDINARERVDAGGEFFSGKHGAENSNWNPLGTKKFDCKERLVTSINSLGRSNPRPVPIGLRLVPQRLPRCM